MIITSIQRLASSAAHSSSTGGVQALIRAINNPRYDVMSVHNLDTRRSYFASDVGLGANSIKADKHFVKNNLSTDTVSVLTSLVQFRPEGYEAKLEEYKAAFREIQGREPLDHELRQMRPWVALGFADRRVLEQPVPYVNYYRQAVNTALARNGQVHFYLGGFNAHEYVTSIVRTEQREKKTFAQFAATVDYSTLVNAGKGGDANVYTWHPESDASAVNKGRTQQPTITSVELYDATAGRFSETGRRFHYYSADGERLDTDQLLELQAKVLQAVSTEENASLLAEGKEFTPEAKMLIEKLQRYFDTGKMN